MKKPVRKIEKLFPSVYITLISILLGFAVEDVISRLQELNSIHIYDALKAVSILSGIFAAWTGLSFISMTQERLPRLLDGLNVFALAIGFYVLISSLGKENWYFFAFQSIYMFGAVFSVIYNLNLLLEVLPTSYTLRVFRMDILLAAFNLLIYPPAAWMSMKGILPSGIEIFLIAYVAIANGMFTISFYKSWSKLIKDIQ